MRIYIERWKSVRNELNFMFTMSLPASYCLESMGPRNDNFDVQFNNFSCQTYENNGLLQKIELSSIVIDTDRQPST